ncbi:rod shape-determining protein [Candidatus Falkowbacteria bacterium RIFOXYC2_FULL_47_12]|uniref:Cell shape-determining protein MreB n=2 Tax=Candidatus Falkowiibacteriota TaxID=1752728 RepID=A0A1F5TMG8_9BACT|nr:MAG: rod shape-determining protein [Candidatus Falkowbacteria bacterium RIFOXYA2_FULL_47_9]OGF40066.1 MAG: rod shape-determining protein [Candidatus Falkowbacteria bacterium RIFOXYC2_FULL_47_12]
MFNKFFGKFSKDLGIDLGSSSTLIITNDKGIVINEPSVVAVNSRTDEVLAVGTDAAKMFGKTPQHIMAIHPLTNGVISDFEVAEKMLKYFIDRVHAENFTLIPRPRVVIGIPLDITEVEKKAVEDATKSAGAREILLVETPLASAIGARLPVLEATANMIVDLGGGTTEIAVVSLGGVVTWKNLRLSGGTLDGDIVQYARDEFNMLIGEQVSEEIKKRIGSAAPLAEEMVMPMRGRDLVNGLPREVMISDGQVREALGRSVYHIIENIKAALEMTPPELVSDIYERGIILTGGGALLRGLDKEIARATQIPVRIADDPGTCVVRGTGKILENIEVYRNIFSGSASN